MDREMPEGARITSTVQPYEVVADIAKSASIMTRRIVTAQAATAVAILLTSCAAPGIATLVNVEGSGSEYFRIDKPTVFARAEGAEITGLVCRRDRTTQLTPDVRIEHLDASGGVIEVTKGDVPTISVKQDQPCSRYYTLTDWRVSEDTHIRICIDRGMSCRPSQ
jgi:hypothetical protein